jgi:uncharacterized membrane protein YphA (DoxX/SURF4 family)
MNSPLFILVAAIALGVLLFTKGIGTVLKSVLYVAVAGVIVVYLGNKSDWSLSGLMEFVSVTMVAIGGGAAPFIDSIFNQVGGAASELKV